MTNFKHNKPINSETYRSFEKIAIEKGMVKPEPKITKTASSLNLNPSNDLMENIIKLCQGLKKEGLVNYADELMNSFWTYKKADDAIQSGKKILYEAHPEGSHDLEGVLGDGTVEDLIDNYMKILVIVEKEPKGKLSSASIKRFADISLPEVAKKFFWFSDHLSRNIIDKMVHKTNDPNVEKYYQTAIQYHELSLNIFNALNVDKELPEAEVVKMVKSMLQNDPLTQQASLSINSITDIDKFTDNVLNYFEDNNPANKIKTSKQILNALKVVLGQENIEEKRIQSNIDKLLSQAKNTWDYIDGIVEKSGHLIDAMSFGRGGIYKQFSNKIVNYLTSSPDLDAMESAKQLILKTKNELTPGFTGGVGEEAWSRIKNSFNLATQYIDRAKTERQKLNELQSKKEQSKTDNTVPEVSEQNEFVPSTDKNVNDFKKYIDMGLRNLKLWKTVLNSKRQIPKDKKIELNGWLDSQSADLMQMNADFIKQPLDQQSQYVNSVASDLIQIIKENREFENEWIKPYAE